MAAVQAISLTGLMLWLSIAVVLIFLAAFPGVLDRTSTWLGIAYGPATFLLGAVTILFLIVATGVFYAVKRKVWADVH